MNLKPKHFLALLALALPTCRSALFYAPPNSSESPQRILWSDSEAYRAQIATFHITESQAIRLAHPNSTDPTHDTPPTFVAGRWYHFADDRVIGQSNLAGLYIHGDTGEIQSRPDHRIIQFDNLLGDKIIPNPHPSNQNP